jgi:hypothetical protein
VTCEKIAFLLAGSECSTSSGGSAIVICREFGLNLSTIVPPLWSDPEEQLFTYLGRY